ncbi:MAG: hypothetical protein U0X71_06995 [Sphingobacteriaceae bacterium]
MKTHCKSESPEMFTINAAVPALSALTRPKPFTVAEPLPYS